MSARNIPYEKCFEMWYELPFKKLEEGDQGREPKWNGAYLALSMGLFLCERFYRTKTGTHDIPTPEIKGLQGYENAFKFLAAKEMGIPHDAFNNFWTVFRHGMQHQGMPRLLEIKDKGGNITGIFKGRISARTGFTETPTQIIENGVTYIKINPWDFTRTMIKKFKDNPEIIRDGFHHAFADVYEDE